MSRSLDDQFDKLLTEARQKANPTIEPIVKEEPIPIIEKLSENAERVIAQLMKDSPKFAAWLNELLIYRRWDTTPYARRQPDRGPAHYTYVILGNEGNDFKGQVKGTTLILLKTNPRNPDEKPAIEIRLWAPKFSMSVSSDIVDQVGERKIIQDILLQLQNPEDVVHYLLRRFPKIPYEKL